MHDVVVVGGGPAGCYAASLLAQRGLDVHVLEEHPTIGEPVDCSGVIGAESFDTLGLPSSLKLSEIRTLTFVSPSKLEVRFSPQTPLAYVLDRAAFDRAIANRTSASGATFRLGTRVVDIHVSDDYVELEVVRQTSTFNVQGPMSKVQGAKSNYRSLGGTSDELRFTNNGYRRSIKARVAILANGPRYKLQRKLGMGAPKAFLRTAQAEVSVRDVGEAKVFLGTQVAPGSFAWIVPFRRGGEQWARIGVSAKANAVPYFQSLLSDLHVQGHVRSLNPSIRCWVIPITPLARTYSERVLAVGDAAGQTKPTTGGGIFYGLLCAEAAAVTALRAFEKGDFGLSVFKQYERAWRKRIGPEIRTGAMFRKLAEQLTDSDMDDLFRIVQSDGILPSISRNASFDWHRDVIYFVLRHPELGKIFLRGFFR